MLADELREQLTSAGFVCVREPLSVAEYIVLAAELGRVVQAEQIALRPGAHAYVAQPGRVPLHNDQPEVDVIGWWCEAQDDEDDASLLLDTRPVVEQLDEDLRRHLRQIHLLCPPLENGPPTERRPVLRRMGHDDVVFCPPWLLLADDTQAARQSLTIFQEAVSSAAQTSTKTIRLQPGQALFVDNRRVLHGRGPIKETSGRRLHRVWIQERAAGANWVNKY